MTEIEINLRNLIRKDENLSFKFRLEFKRLLKLIRKYIDNHKDEIIDISFEFRLEYKSLLESIRDYINNHGDRIIYKKEANKLSSLIEVNCYLCKIEYYLTQIRLHNIYIEVNEN